MIEKQEYTRFICDSCQASTDFSLAESPPPEVSTVHFTMKWKDIHLCGGCTGLALSSVNVSLREGVFDD